MSEELQYKIIRVLIVESHEIIRIGLRTLIESQSVLQVVAEADCFDVALNLAVQHSPDVILLDLLLNDGNCIEHIPKLLQNCPQSRILIFSSDNEEQTHLHALRSGAAGIIAKHQRAELLLKAVHAVHAGEVWFDQHIVKLLWQTQVNYQPPITQSPITNGDTVKSYPYCLTAREYSVACLASKGLSAKKIGEQLFISEKTVRNQLTIVYQKLGVGSQIDLCVSVSQLDFF